MAEKHERVAVSYTHLDVYKRQIYLCFFYSSVSRTFLFFICSSSKLTHCSLLSELSNIVVPVLNVIFFLKDNRFYALFFGKFRQSLHNEPFGAEMTGIHHA